MKVRKSEFRTKKIAQLTEELRQTKSAFDALQEENRVLRTRLDGATKALAQTEKELQTYVCECDQSIITARDARKTYEALSRECMEIKSEYTRQMRQLINGAKKMIRN